MNFREDVEYRLNLAAGFLKEAEEDFQSLKLLSNVYFSISHTKLLKP